MTHHFFGYVECRPSPAPDWVAVADAYLFEVLYDDSDDVREAIEAARRDEHAMLFGVGNPARGYVPVAAGRGLPPHPSAAVLDECDGYGATWIGWDEIRTIDWAASPYEEVARRASAPVAGLPAPPERLTGGEAAWAAGSGIPPRWMRDDGDGRLHLLDGILRTFDLMAVTASLFGDDRVRLVVWFG